MAAIGQVCNSEVSQLDAPVASCDNHIGGFDIAMDNTVLVSKRQRLGHLQGGIERQVEWHWTVVHDVAQGRTGEVLHGDVSEFVGFAHIENGHYIGMRQPAGTLRLA